MDEQEKSVTPEQGGADTQDEVCISEQEYREYQSILDEHCEGDDAEMAISLTAIIELLFQKKILRYKDFRKRYHRLLSEYDQEIAVMRDLWMDDMKRRCPTIVKVMDERFGKGEWGPEHVQT